MEEGLYSHIGGGSWNVGRHSSWKSLDFSSMNTCPLSIPPPYPVPMSQGLEALLRSCLELIPGPPSGRQPAWEWGLVPHRAAGTQAFREEDTASIPS